MQEFKKSVKTFLQTVGKDRFWLSEKIGTPKRTIDNWLSESGNMPAKGFLLLSEFMKNYKARNTIKGGNKKHDGEQYFLELKFSVEEMELLKAAARLHGQTVTERAALLLKLDAEDNSVSMGPKPSNTPQPPDA